MAQYSGHYYNAGGHTQCPLCLTHLDSQVFSFTCPIIITNVDLSGQYTDVLEEKITTELANTLVMIEQYRNENLNT